MSGQTPEPTTRPAQRYYLESAARDAVERALELPDPKNVEIVRDIREHCESCNPGMSPILMLEHFHRSAIADAARAIEKAELVAREIAKCGGMAEIRRLRAETTPGGGA